MKLAARWVNRSDRDESVSWVQPPVGGAYKRGFDICGALAGIVLLAPLLLMLAALVKYADGGSVLYRHRRIGRSGRSFDCLKFRTMVVNGDAALEEYLARNPESREEWRLTRKLKHDPRVTRVGVVLRKLSLDELPQIFNILLGDMSIVGPRPVVKKELEMYGPASRYYLQTRPGLTGLWQVSGRNDVSYRQRVAFDTHYVENWSPGFDIEIIIRTFPAVYASRGSY